LLLLLFLLLLIYIHSIARWACNCSCSAAIIPCCSSCIARILLLLLLCIRQHFQLHEHNLASIHPHINMQLQQHHPLSQLLFCC
jgi:hypothetical protein